MSDLYIQGYFVTEETSLLSDCFGKYKDFRLIFLFHRMIALLLILAVAAAEVVIPANYRKVTVLILSRISKATLPSEAVSQKIVYGRCQKIANGKIHLDLTQAGLAQIQETVKLFCDQST